MLKIDGSTLNDEGDFERIEIYNSLGTLVHEGFIKYNRFIKLENGIYSHIVRTDILKANL